jgi:hypothetical protein
MLELAFLLIGTGLVLRWLLSHARERGQYEEACEDRLVKWCVPDSRG